MITNDSVERVCSEVNNYSDEQMTAEFDRFFQEQPVVCDFVVEATIESDPKIQELSLFLAYMIFKAVKFHQPGNMNAVTPEMIETAYRESEYWIDRINEAADPQNEEVPGNPKDDPEPHLVQYIISELNEPFEDGGELEDEQKGEVFFVLKTVISSLARRTV